MNRIERMLRELCPEGVEYRKLGEICKILDSKRKPVAKGRRLQGNYPYYGANGIQDYVDDYIFDGTFILLGEDGSVINSDKSPVLNWAKGKIWVNNHAHILAEIPTIANLRYLYFALQTKDVSSIVRGTPPKLNQENLKNIEIPVPPLPIQEEIVRILDHFTELAAELQAELQARKEQYEYYRNKLLTFEEDDERVRWTKLGEIMYVSDYVSAGSFASIKENVKYLSSPDYAVLLRFADFSSNFDSSKFIYVNKRAYDYLCKSNLHPGDIVMSNVGSCGALFTCPDLGMPMTLAPNSIVIRTPNNRFYYHWFMSAMAQKQISKIKSKSAMPKFNKTDFKNILIPIPPLSEQQRIVSILDKFEGLVNDLSRGLPAEIAAVQEQYEYYRDKLLTFNPIKSN